MALNESSQVPAALLAAKRPMEIPAQSWDSHMHVFEPSSLDSPDSRYHPIPSALPQALDFEASLGFRNIVLVQPSCYGNDNSYLLQALAQHGSRRARGVVVFDPSTTPLNALQDWHRLGVRGVRVNLKSQDATITRPAFESLLRSYSDAIRPLDWVLQLYIPMDLLTWLEAFAPSLNVRICVDHFGCPDLRTLQSGGSLDDIPGYRSLINLIKQGKTYVKISGAYRILQDASARDLEAMILDLLREAGMTRLVFGTDWPHTRYNGLDIKPFLQFCIEGCHHDSRLIDRLFRGNAEDLWSPTQSLYANL